MKIKKIDELTYQIVNKNEDGSLLISNVQRTDLERQKEMIEKDLASVVEIISNINIFDEVKTEEENIRKNEEAAAEIISAKEAKLDI